jgi:hypothetical protein
MIKDFLKPAVILFLMVSCSSNGVLSEKEKAMISNEVRTTLNQYCQDVKTSGLTAEFQYLDSSDDFFWVPPGYQGPIGYDSVSIILKQSAPRYKSIENTFESLKIVVLTSEIATYTARLKSHMVDSSDIISNFSLLETGTLIKRKNGWKLLNGQTSLTP